MREYNLLDNYPKLNEPRYVAKNLRTISDVDDSLDKFESNFFNTYASLIPRDVAVDKEFLIKNGDKISRKAPVEAA